MTLSQKHARMSGVITFDRIAKLLGVRSCEEWDDDNIDGFWPYDVEDYDDAIKLEEETRDEAFRQYKSAVLAVAEDVFGHHALVLSPLKDAYRFRVLPRTTWKEAANHVRETINGAGYFHFSSLKGFLDSGPYSARQAVFSHLGWIPDWYRVYGDGTASYHVERKLR